MKNITVWHFCGLALLAGKIIKTGNFFLITSFALANSSQARVETLVMEPIGI